MEFHIVLKNQLSTLTLRGSLVDSDRMKAVGCAAVRQSTGGGGDARSDELHGGHHLEARSEPGDYPPIIECKIIVNHKKVDLGQELVIHREKPVVAKKGKSVAVTLDGAAMVGRPTKQAKLS